MGSLRFNISIPSYIPRCTRPLPGVASFPTPYSCSPSRQYFGPIRCMCRAIGVPSTVVCAGVLRRTHRPAPRGECAEFGSLASNCFPNLSPVSMLHGPRRWYSSLRRAGCASSAPTVVMRGSSSRVRLRATITFVMSMFELPSVQLHPYPSGASATVGAGGTSTAAADHCAVPQTMCGVPAAGGGSCVPNARPSLRQRTATMAIDRPPLPGPAAPRLPAPSHTNRPSRPRHCLPLNLNLADGSRKSFFKLPAMFAPSQVIQGWKEALQVTSPTSPRDHAHPSAGKVCHPAHPHPQATCHT